MLQPEQEDSMRLNLKSGRAVPMAASADMERGCGSDVSQRQLVARVLQETGIMPADDKEEFRASGTR